MVENEITIHLRSAIAVECISIQHLDAHKSSVLDDRLVYPSVSESSRSASEATLPKHLCGDQFIQYYVQEKKEEKEVKNEKVRHKEERLQKRRSMSRTRKNYKRNGERT